MEKKKKYNGFIALGLLLLFGLFLGGPLLKKFREQNEKGFGEVAPGEISAVHPGCLFGRVTTVDGLKYEGRLRFGGDEEAFWDHTFNGTKKQNPWATHVPSEFLKERRGFQIGGVSVGSRQRKINLHRPFMARFGDLARVEANGRDLMVTLKSGTVFHLDRWDADDFADGVRIWDQSGIVDIHERRIRSIEFLPASAQVTATNRLHGTVRTKHGSFTGFIQWNRESSIRSDKLGGSTGKGEAGLSFDTIRSITRMDNDSVKVALSGSKEVVFSGSSNVGKNHRGIYVDDPRYGRVLVSWSVFENIDFSDGGSGQAYGSFLSGRPLKGSVTTRDGRRLVGRLVYDLDESETTETLDAPNQGVDYSILFGLIQSIVLPASKDSSSDRVRLILHSGEQIELERAGDLSASNAGMLIFEEGSEKPHYLPWAEVQRVDLVK